MKQISQSQVHNEFFALQNQCFIKMTPSLQGIPNWQIMPTKKRDKNYSQNVVSQHLFSRARTTCTTYTCNPYNTYTCPAQSGVCTICTMHIHDPCNLYDVFMRPQQSVQRVIATSTTYTMLPTALYNLCLPLYLLPICCMNYPNLSLLPNLFAVAHLLLFSFGLRKSPFLSL
jgi:hypothetical protein